MIAGLFTYMDIVIVAILLIAGIIGAIKGFANQVFSLLSLALVLVVSGFLCGKLASFLSPVFGGSLQNGFREWIVSKDIEGLFTNKLDWSGLTNAQTQELLAKLNIPAFIVNIISPTVCETIRGLGECVLADGVSVLLADLALNVICFIAIMIVVGIILIFVKKAVLKALQKPALGFVNRLLGFIVSVVYTYALVSVILAIFTAFAPNISVLGGVQEFIAEQAVLSESAKIPFFHWFYNNNFIGELVMKLLVKEIA